MNTYPSPGHYISTVYRHLQIHLNGKFAEYGFGSGQYHFFNFIAQDEGITQKELSRRLAIDKATTAKAVKKLAELGYIRIETSEEDKRFNNLYLSDKGREILPGVRRVLKETRGILYRGFTDEESEQSLVFLSRMFENITDEIQFQRINSDR